MHFESPRVFRLLLLIFLISIFVKCHLVSSSVLFEVLNEVFGLKRIERIWLFNAGFRKYIRLFRQRISPWDYSPKITIISGKAQLAEIWPVAANSEPDRNGTKRNERSETNGHCMPTTKRKALGNWGRMVQKRYIVWSLWHLKCLNQRCRKVPRN